jgi:phospho-N-acetylmuramoyl-pentapeptide-transferase
LYWLILRHENTKAFPFILAMFTAFAVSIIVGAWLIWFFRRKNVIEDTTQPDHAGLNAIQSQKKNVPTMGGLMILAGVVVAALLWCQLDEAYIWVGILVLAVLGGAGFIDDYIKLKHKPSRGLTKTQKLLIQFILGGVVGYLINVHGHYDNPYGALACGTGSWHLGWMFIPWSGFVMAATSNAVNLTDGLDGLAGGLVLIAMLMFGFLGEDLAAWSGWQHDVGLICFIVAGAVLGFLWFNCHPAQIFMGDTGSLPLGGLLAYVALAWQAEFFLLALCSIFFIEELTVAMQIAIFKLTKKRIFPITPIHHYFQVNLKWPEQKIVTRAWILGGLFAFLSALYVAHLCRRTN